MATADRHVLFGLLALQVGLIDQSQLVGAFQAWTRDKARGLADHLAARGALDDDQQGLLDALAAQHLRKHGGDAEKSLGSLAVGRSTFEAMKRVGDAEVDATLTHVGSASTEHVDHDRTATYSIGSATSDGQRFRVLRPHAQGGLGAVFVAFDGELHREVALKQILDRHADNPTSRHRFLLEAEITGGLEHPGIVPVYGLGAYGDGRPFYAMRFIRGDSLKEAIAAFHDDDRLRADPGARSLALRKLLRRFTDVCNAIEYAHTRGVLHRDIKPGNVIVGRHGETLVVDWGLAKAVGATNTDAPDDERPLNPSSAGGSAETLPGSALGTPAYMSPEQAVGDLARLGPHSDVYSLGATLYSVLTGKPPFEGADLGATLRAVQKGDFLPLRAVDPKIDPALEAVCLKAMALNPVDRYASCRALADDVERWAADEPVSAWREPFARRARRWAKQNRTAVTAAAVALIAGVVGLSAVIVVQTRANTALAAANSDLTRSKAAVQDRYDLAVEAVRTFHTGVSGDFLLKEATFKDLRDRLLMSASGFYGKLGALLGKETDLVSRRALTAANFEVAALTDQVGRKADALEAHRRVLRAREALASGPGTDAEMVADVGRSLTAVALLLEDTGKTDDAVATFRKAEALLATPVASGPAAAPVRAALVACRARLGYLLHRTGHAAAGLSMLRQSRADQEVLAGASDATDETRAELARMTYRIGTLLAMMGKPADAGDEYRVAMATWEKMADDNPSVTGFRNSLADTHNKLGAVLYRTGKPAEAEAEHRKAMAIWQGLSMENPAVSSFRDNLADAHHNLGVLLYRQSVRQAEAETEYRAAMATWQKLADDDPAATGFRNSLAMSHGNLSSLLRASGKPTEAEAEQKKAVAIWQKLKDDAPDVSKFRNNLASGYFNLGVLHWQAGNLAEGEAEYRAAMATWQKLADDDPAMTEFRANLATSHANLGILLAAAGKPLEAEAEGRAALATWQKLTDDIPAATEFRASLATSQGNLSFLLSAAGKPAEAEIEGRAALVTWQKLADGDAKVPDYRNMVATALNQISDVIRPLGRAAEARDGYERSIAIRERLVEEFPAATLYRGHLAYSLRRRGLARRDLGDSLGAAGDARRALVLFEQLPSRGSDEWFESACCRAALAGLAGRDGAGVSAAEGEAESVKAMGLLSKAVGAGYRNANALRTESALEALRDRPDFRLLMLDLAMPTDPFAPAR